MKLVNYETCEDTTLAFLKRQQDIANERLNRDGFLFASTLCEMLADAV